jgi:ketosteroid isomerase-like protein
MLANLELVRSIYVAWRRGDFSSAGWAHPEIELVVADGPDPGSWIGLAAMAEAARDRLSAWEDYRYVVDELRELDAERVLALHHRAGRGKTSGLVLGRIPARGAHVFHLRGGKVTKLVHYLDSEHALAAVGLAAEVDPPQS